MLYRVKGSGTYVSEGGVIEKPLSITSFTDDMLARGLQPSSRIIDIAIGHGRDDLAIAEDLNLRPADKTILIRRVRLADGDPMAYECVVLPYDLVPQLEQSNLKGSLYATLLSEYGLRVERIHQRIRAVALSQIEAEYLDSSVGEPALRFVRIGCDKRGVPLERAVTLYRGDRYEFTLGASRGDD